MKIPIISGSRRYRSPEQRHRRHTRVLRVRRLLATTPEASTRPPTRSQTSRSSGRRCERQRRQQHMDMLRLQLHLIPTTVARTSPTTERHNEAVKTTQQQLSTPFLCTTHRMRAPRATPFTFASHRRRMTHLSSPTAMACSACQEVNSDRQPGVVCDAKSR